jgi:amino acid efflux transporter
MAGGTGTLEESLTLGPAVGLAITMVVGSGLLVLPGLAYASVGATSAYAWLISALVCIPLLVVFASLGASIPGAGGIAGFVQATFSRRLGAATEILILGTVPGGAAVAVTGGRYFAAALGGEDGAVVAGTVLILATGCAVNLLGARVSGRVQQVLAFGLVALLGGVAALALVLGDHHAGAGIAPPSELLAALPAVGAVFFAFVGWELLSFTTEEFKDPRRDFPRAIAGSYIVVVGLYALIVVAVQTVMRPGDPALQSAPIAALLASVLGLASGRFVAAIGFVLILANYVSVVWAISRLVFSSAREGLLPGGLRHLAGAGVPRRAVVAVSCTFGLIAIPALAGAVSLSRLFEMAGASFFLAYVLCVLAFLHRASSAPRRVFGVGTLVFAGLVFLSFGLMALYPVAVFAGGVVLAGAARRRPGGEPAANP